jgi:hypothetical protein
MSNRQQRSEVSKSHTVFATGKTIHFRRSRAIG